jgi:hypothetical protein
LVDLFFHDTDNLLDVRKDPITRFTMITIAVQGATISEIKPQKSTTVQTILPDFIKDVVILQVDLQVGHTAHDDGTIRIIIVVVFACSGVVSVCFCCCGCGFWLGIQIKVRTLLFFLLAVMLFYFLTSVVVACCCSTGMNSAVVDILGFSSNL